MTTLNAGAARAMLAIGVQAATDVTGFGLLGHLREMLAASGVAARIWLETVPMLDEAWDLAAAGCIPDGSYNNGSTTQRRANKIKPFCLPFRR